MQSKSPWWLYVCRCSDLTYYTGISTDFDKRIKTHNQGRGAKYTRSRLPVELVRFWKYPDRSTASKAEHAFKKLTRKQKEEIINERITENIFRLDL